jgi:mRNA interferase MazF
VKRAPKRGDVVFASLLGAVGGEIRKPRPWLIVSPDEVNACSRTITVVPLATGEHPYPFRVPCEWRGIHGHVIVDQLRTVDRTRIERIAGEMPLPTMRRVLQTLREMFAD